MTADVKSIVKSETKDIKLKSETKDVKLGAKDEPAKPKPSGKLDFFSKAKTAAPKTIHETVKAEPAEPSSVSEVAPKPEPVTLKAKNKVSFPRGPRCPLIIYVY